MPFSKARTLRLSSRELYLVMHLPFDLTICGSGKSYGVICCCRMDEMMRGQRGWRELAVLGDKINKFTGMIEGLIWSPRSGDGNDQVDEWAFEEVLATSKYTRSYC